MAVHLAEVMRNVSNMGTLTDALIVAVIWHDYMKVRDYRIERLPDGVVNIVKQPYRKLINHVAGSFAEFYHQAKLIGASDEFIEEVGHLLLSHHGRREWGSPVEPYTAEAFPLHAADMMSSRGVNL